MQRLNGGRSKILETRTGLLTTAPARILIPMWGGAISPSGDMPKNRVRFIKGAACLSFSKIFPADDDEDQPLSGLSTRLQYQPRLGYRMNFCPIARKAPRGSNHDGKHARKIGAAVAS